MLKLILIAPTCDGQDVGEAWVAYQWVHRLAARHEVTVLTYYKRGRTPLSQQLAGRPGLRVIEWAEPRVLGQPQRLNSMLKPGYMPFYFRARRWLRAALARGERFDVAHQPVPVAARYPSPAAGLGIPLVMGPVGGSLPSPPAFRAEEGTTAWYVRLRGLDRARLRFDPWLRRTYQQASCVIGIAPYVDDLLSTTAIRRFEVLSETGLDRLPAPASGESAEPGQSAEPADRAGSRDVVRLLFVGRLVRTKGARDAIRALGLIRDLPVRLDVIGDGFDRAACEALTRTLGLTGRVHFHGWLPRPRVDEFYRAADVFVFPSYREPGGNVTFEAMGHGLPVIVSDIGGPGAVVDDTCGIRIHPESPEQYARDLAAALARLVTQPGQRRSLGEGARRRVSEIGLWDNKPRQIEAIYAKVLAGDTA